VIVAMREITKTLAADKYTGETIDFVALMHDLGKVGDVGTPLYLPNPDSWQREKQGKIYLTNKDLPYMPITDRTMWLLHKFKVDMTVEEYLAIKLSDGMYEPTNTRFGMKEPDLALLLHWADRWATAEEK
jgi:hypothetical protein